MARKPQQQVVESKPAAGLVAPSRKDIIEMNYEADAGKGLENIDADSVAIPFFTALQKMSPQCDPDSPDYMPKAKPGMLYNTVTRDLHSGEGGVQVIPCSFRRTFIRWGARKAGGGFKGTFTPEAAAMLRANGEVVELEGKYYFPDDNGNVNPDRQDKLADTREHFVIVLNEDTGELQQAVMSLKSTQIKKSKQLMTMLSNVKWERADGSKFTPSSYAIRLNVTTVPEKNDEGTWSGYRFDLAGRVSDPAAYAMARDFHRIVSDGKAVVDHSKDIDSADTEENQHQQRGGGRGGKF